jgi:type IV fimbrial biogenesis protein FimT
MQSLTIIGNKPSAIEKKPNVSGFTLLEMLFVLAITALLVSLAAPGFQAYSAQARAKNSIHKLSGVLRQARNHAVHHQKSVLVCPSHDGLKCHAQGWENGLMIFEDNNNNRLAEPSDNLIFFQSPFIEHARLDWNRTDNYLIFSELGLPSGSAGSFVYCPGNRDSRYAHALIISFSGKMRLAEDHNQDGIREAGNSANIVCQ